MQTVCRIQLREQSSLSASAAPPVVAFDIEFMAILALFYRMGLGELVPVGPLSYRYQTCALAERAGVLHVLKHSIPYKIGLVRNMFKQGSQLFVSFERYNLCFFCHDCSLVILCNTRGGCVSIGCLPG